MDYDELVALALSYPEAEEGTSWREPAVRRDGRFMFCLKKDGETVAIKLDWDSHDRLLASHPDVFYKTPHYEGYPAFLVRLAKLSKRLAKDVVTASWENAPKPAKRRR